jgi:hypothetical protein
MASQYRLDKALIDGEASAVTNSTTWCSMMRHNRWPLNSMICAAALTGISRASVNAACSNNSVKALPLCNPPLFFQIAPMEEALMMHYRVRQKALM